jgi:integrase
MSKRTINKLRHKDLLAEVAKLRSAKATGKFGDGGGLWLVVTSAGRARFVHKYQWHGRTAERWFPGDFPDGLGLADARDLRDADRKLLRADKNPITTARAAAEAARGVPTFGAYCQAHVAFLAPRNPKSRATWLRQMTREDTDGETVGRLATMPIDEITMADVKAVIAPLWMAKPPTAKELCARIRRVLDHRQVNVRPDDERRNPADFARIQRAIGKRYDHRSRPRAALPYLEAPEFLRRLRERPQLSARALEMVILTACRAGEVTGARWSELDLKARTLTIPASRMKAQHDVYGEPHVIPLSIAMVSVLRRARPPHRKPRPDDLIFPNRKGKPYDDRDLLAHVKAVTGDGPATTHGFRSTFMAWATAIPHGEHSPFARELASVCIAHAIGSATDQAYLRDRWLDRRRVVMREWSRFCDLPGAIVVPMRRAA